jgi:ribosomal protein L37AE/L43A
MTTRTVMNGAVTREMEPIIEQAEKDGMELLGWACDDYRSNNSEDVPSWIELPDEWGLSGSRGEYITITGNTYVYLAISNGSSAALVYRQLKSEYYETTNDEGTCPNCQKYVRRMEGDDILTCHRCGWQYGRPRSGGDESQSLLSSVKSSFSGFLSE